MEGNKCLGRTFLAEERGHSSDKGLEGRHSHHFSTVRVRGVWWWEVEIILRSLDSGGGDLRLLEGFQQGSAMLDLVF
jgi:hypothetical protein